MIGVKGILFINTYLFLPIDQTNFNIEFVERMKHVTNLEIIFEMIMIRRCVIVASF